MLADEGAPTPPAHSKDYSKSLLSFIQDTGVLAAVSGYLPPSARTDLISLSVKSRYLTEMVKEHSGCSPMQLQRRRRHQVLYKSSELHHFIFHKHINNKCMCCICACICRPVCVHVQVYVSMCTYILMYMCLYVCSCMCVCVCTCPKSLVIQKQ